MRKSGEQMSEREVVPGVTFQGWPWREKKGWWKSPDQGVQEGEKEKPPDGELGRKEGGNRGMKEDWLRVTPYRSGVPGTGRGERIGKERK